MCTVLYFCLQLDNELHSIAIFSCSLLKHKNKRHLVSYKRISFLSILYTGEHLFNNCIQIIPNTRIQSTIEHWTCIIIHLITLLSNICGRCADSCWWERPNVFRNPLSSTMWRRKSMHSGINTSCYLKLAILLLNYIGNSIAMILFCHTHTHREKRGQQARCIGAFCSIHSPICTYIFFRIFLYVLSAIFHSLSLQLFCCSLFFLFSVEYCRIYSIQYTVHKIKTSSMFTNYIKWKRKSS